MVQPFQQHTLKQSFTFNEHCSKDFKMVPYKIQSVEKLKIKITVLERNMSKETLAEMRNSFSRYLQIDHIPKLFFLRCQIPALVISYPEFLINVKSVPKIKKKKRKV